jgi:membrane protein insertase Oxa1/YidC/SpoIIIJ
LEKDIIRQIYDRLERNLLLLMALPLPVFAVIYLKAGKDGFEQPTLAIFGANFLLAMALFLLGLQYFNFQKQISHIRQQDEPLELRMTRYEKAIMSRYWILFAITWISGLGLYLFGNQLFSVIFALALIAFSLGKAMPRRIIKQLGLKGEEKEKIEALSKRVAL